MPETVLEAAWRTKRQVKILYDGHTRSGYLSALGIFAELRPGVVMFRALGGFEFEIEIADIMQIDGRNPLIDDSPTAQEPSKQRIVYYHAGTGPQPNQELHVLGVVTQERGALRVETNDDFEVIIPSHLVVRIENPDPSGNPNELYFGHMRIEKNSVIKPNGSRMVKVK